VLIVVVVLCCSSPVLLFLWKFGVKLLLAFTCIKLRLDLEGFSPIEKKLKMNITDKPF
jgi:hypothetical protein